MMQMSTCLLSLPPSPFNDKTHSCHVYSGCQLTSYTSMCGLWLSFPLTSTYSPMLFFLSCSCFISLLLQWAITHSRGQADMRLILGEVCANCAAAVRLYAEKYPLGRLSKAHLASFIVASERPALFTLLQ